MVLPDIVIALGNIRPDQRLSSRQALGCRQNLRYQGQRKIAGCQPKQSGSVQDGVGSHESQADVDNKDSGTEQYDAAIAAIVACVTEFKFVDPAQQ